MRRAQALHPAAFLIDQHGGVFAEQVAEGVGQRPHLIRRGDIAPKQDQAPRPRLGEEGALLFCQLKAGASCDKGLEAHAAVNSASVFRDEA